MMKKAAKTYAVVYKLDDQGWWAASIPQVEGCHTQGRSIRQARARVREALSVCLDDETAAAAATLIDDVRLPTSLKGVVAVHRKAVKAAASKHAELQRTRQQVARMLAKSGLSVRDVAEILDISHQRVQQLVG